MTESTLRSNLTVSRTTHQVYEIFPSYFLVVFVEVNSVSLSDTIIHNMNDFLKNLSAEIIISGFQPSCTYICT